MSFKTCKIFIVGLAALLLSHCATSNPARTDFVPSTSHTTEQLRYYQDQLNGHTFDRIALLLPGSGTHQQFAQVIQDGIFYAYFQMKAAHPNLSIQIYDTTSGISITKLYQKAIDEGAQFVIGPLSKEDVDEIANLSASKIRVPTLLLNEPSRAYSLPPGLFTLSLTPEYEMEFLAASLVTQGIYQIGFISSPDLLGERLKKAFMTKFTAMGGEIVIQASAEGGTKQANTVQQLLGLNLSQTRYEELKQLLKRKLSFQPRRRQDIDAIVLGTNTAQAKQLKPLLDFYYAETIPVFGHTALYQGDGSKKIESDLNGIQFCDMPFLLNNQTTWQAARQSFYDSRPSSEQSLARLYALGLDAMMLSQEIQTVFTNTKGLKGATGALYLDENQRILRQLSKVIIQDGKLILAR